MKKLNIEDIKPNSLYNDSLWLEEKFILLHHNIPVKASLLQTLQKWSYKELYTKGELIAKEEHKYANEVSVPEGTIPTEKDIEIEKRYQARKTFTELSNFIKNSYENFRSKKKLDINEMMEKAKETIQLFREQKNYMLRLPEFKTDNCDFFIENAAKTTILAIAIGERLKLLPFRLIELGVAAMLHNIGMMKIPPEIYNKKTPLSDNEKKLLVAHNVMGLQMLNNYARTHKEILSQDIIITIGQYREREDGSGFPEGRKSQGITLLSKILAVANVYVARTSPPPYGEKMDAYSTMLLMLKEANIKLDKLSVMALFSSISLYPLGTYVRLSTNDIGVVVATTPNNPKNPIVKLIANNILQLYKKEPLVDLHKHEDISIINILNKPTIDNLIDKEIILPLSSPD